MYDYIYCLKNTNNDLRRLPYQIYAFGVNMEMD